MSRKYVKFRNKLCLVIKYIDDAQFTFTNILSIYVYKCFINLRLYIYIKTFISFETYVLKN